MDADKVAEAARKQLARLDALSLQLDSLALRVEKLERVNPDRAPNLTLLPEGVVPPVYVVCERLRGEGGIFEYERRTGPWSAYASALCTRPLHGLAILEQTTGRVCAIANGKKWVTVEPDKGEKK